MQIIRNKPSEVLEPCVATIGFFDGVHIGHRFLIDQVKEVAAARGVRSALVTFPVHPRKVMNSEYRPELLTTQEEKTDLLAGTGVDYCFMLDFTPELSQLSAREFMTHILKERYQADCLVIGYDHRFGHNRSEGFDDYVRYGQEIGMEVILARACTYNDIHISSSVVRNYLRQGEVSMASLCLGYDYYLEGTVVDGYKMGRKIGFPTANLRVDDPDKLVPSEGVYAVRVSFGGHTYTGMLGIGRRPTFNDNSDRSIEVHIFQFNSDIYDEFIRISFVQYIRPDMKFNSVDELIAQLHQDSATVQALFRQSEKDL